MKSCNVNGKRHYICKLCGREILEPLPEWRKKPQKLKRVCNLCIDLRNVAAQDWRERAEHIGYGGLRINELC